MKSVTNIINFLGHHQWNWIDYSSYDYNHWNDGEPNSNDDDRYCAYMYKNNGFWDDTTCYGVYKGYVCQIERSKL